MPLNHNGVVMKKVNFNGTAMKKVNFNGTQMWNSELVIVTGSAFSDGCALTTKQSNWLSAISETTVHQRRPDQPSAGHYVTSAYILLPTADYDTITLTYSSHAHDGFGGIYGGAAAALRPDVVSLKNNDGAMGSLKDGALYSCGNTWGGDTSSKTVTWDISSITTDYYLEIGAYQYGCGTIYGTGSWFKIENLILS